MGNSVLIGKLILVIFGVAASFLLLRWEHLYEIDERRFGGFIAAVDAAFRLGTFVFVFEILRLSPQTDVTVYFADANRVLDHLVPYRDFNTAYAPLFPYLCAMAARLWKSAKVLVLIAAVLDVFCAWVWWKVASSLLEQRTARTAALLYVGSPFMLISTSIMGQNQVWLAAVLGLALLLQLKGQEFASGLLYGFGLAGIKFLAVLFAPVLFIRSGKRLQWLTGFAALPVIVYGTFYHLSGLRSMLYFTRLAPSSGNVFYLLDLAGLPFNSSWTAALSSVMVAVGLIVLFLWALARCKSFDGAQMNTILALIMFVMLFLSRKSLTNYFALVFFPLCVMVSLRLTWRRFWNFSAFTAFIVLEPGFYFRFMGSMSLSSAWRRCATCPRHAVVLVFILIEVALLSFYAYYVRFGWRIMSKQAALASETKAASQHSSM